jgi:NADH dehydrogenase (ubiquinone) flavoprotein 2
LISFR